MSSGRAAAGGRDVAVIIALMLDAGLGAWAGTEWVARRLTYVSALGHPIYLMPAGVGRWWIVAAVAPVVVVAVLLSARRWRRVVPIVTIAAVGCAWVARGEPIYLPWSIIVWHWRFRHGLHLVAIVQEGWVMAALASIVCALVLMPLLVTGGAPVRIPKSQGTAAWDDGGELIVPKGLLIGWQDLGTRSRE